MAVLGHSFGGHAALEYALRYPASLPHLVLLDTGGDARRARQNAADALARRGYTPEKAELVRRWVSGEFTPREYVPRPCGLRAPTPTIPVSPWPCCVSFTRS